MPNALSSASSPYLQQHAENPVEWHEWNEAALALARESDRPILLSIGYAACHWCHVMAHESFEDEATAKLMNEHFVNIKVDREQRPDLDRIYQLTHQLFHRRPGGWPLTAFLDPKTHQPLFVGTYFPREPRMGMPAFGMLLERVSEWYHTDTEARAKHIEALAEFLSEEKNRQSQIGSHSKWDRGSQSAIGDHAQAALERDFDAQHGGFSPAPKFPYATQLTWLLGRDDPRAQHMARFTLEKMCRGGLFDHLGGGFARYSVDERWEIPHFEKMLYDNGLLLAALAHAPADLPLIRRAATMTAEWLIREMQHPDGGFFASVDADSEGHEGKFYVWNAEEVKTALSEAEWAAFAPAFGLDRPANFEGRWHLHNADDTDLTDRAIESARAKLFELREKRVHPGVDDKVLAAWNGLAIRGLAQAGRAFDRPGWIEAAAHAAAFVRVQLWRDGRLVTSWRDGAVVEVSFLDDYAYLLDGLLGLLQARFDPANLEFAIALAEALLERFEDRDLGGFFFTPDDHEKLIQRPKSFMDESGPSGNGIAAFALGRLGHLIGETRYLDAARRTVEAAGSKLDEFPHAHTAMLFAAEDLLDPPTLEIVRGTPDQLAAVGATQCVANKMEFLIASDLLSLPGTLAHQPVVDGKLTLYRCVGSHCEAPETL